LSHFGFDLISNLNWSDISISILAIERDDQEQGFYRGLPFIEMLLGLRQILDKLTAGQGNGIVEGPLPRKWGSSSAGSPDFS